MAKILLVDDDAKLIKTLQRALEDEHYIVEIAASAENALELLTVSHYDLAILDWQLPKMSGVELCQKLRSDGNALPILILTGKEALSDRLVGFDSGADDYLPKPFHFLELSARIRALLKRPAEVRSDVLTWGNIQLDSKNRKVTRAGTEIILQPLEFNLLEFFLLHSDQAIATDTLLKRCWHTDKDVSLESIYSCIRRIRKKLDSEGQPSIIQTLHSLGYRLDSRPKHD